MEMKGDVLEGHAPVVTYGNILHIEDGLIQFMVGMWIHALSLTCTPRHTPWRCAGAYCQEVFIRSQQSDLLEGLNDLCYGISHHVNIGPGGRARGQRFEVQVADDLHAG